VILPFSFGSLGEVKFAVAAGSDIICDTAIFYSATIIAKSTSDITPFNIAINASLP
jgi:microcompartment protein CcmL/EutN